MGYVVEIDEVEPRLVAATRKRTNLSRIGNDIGAGFGLLSQVIAQEGVPVSGPPLVVYYDTMTADTAGDIEICVPVERAVSDGDTVHSRELEGGSVATTVHRGPYQLIPAAYQTVMAWIGQNSHQIAGPPREIYLNDPQEVPAEELLTRIEFPIRAG